MPDTPATILSEAGIEPGVAVRTAEQSFARFIADDRPTEPETAAYALADTRAALLAVCKLAAEQKRNFNGACQNEEDALEKLAAVTGERDELLKRSFPKQGTPIPCAQKESGKWVNSTT